MYVLPLLSALFTFPGSPQLTTEIDEVHTYIGLIHITGKRKDIFETDGWIKVYTAVRKNTRSLGRRQSFPDFVPSQIFKGNYMRKKFNIQANTSLYIFTSHLKRIFE